jgi:hypothetical protein
MFFMGLRVNDRSSGLIALCRASTLDESLEALVKEGREKGLSEEMLPMLLKEGSYEDACKVIWGIDQERRYEVLSSFVDDLHMVVMYELAIEEFRNHPIERTIYEIAIPLIKAASFRFSQDLECSVYAVVLKADIQEIEEEQLAIRHPVSDDLKERTELLRGRLRFWDSWKAHLAEQMEETYLSRLDVLVQTHLRRNLEEILQEHKEEMISNVYDKLLFTAERSMRKRLPTPHWIATIQDEMRERTTIATSSSDDNQKLRNLFAYRILEPFCANRSSYGAA